MQHTPITDTELARIERKSRQRDAVEPRLTEARYDAATGHLMLTLRDDVRLSFPARQLKSLAGATDEQLADLRIMSRGAALFFDSLDVQMTTIALLQLVFKLRSWAELGQRGGQIKSAAKVAAARANGTKGGRPRKQAKQAAA